MHRLTCPIYRSYRRVSRCWQSYLSDSWNRTGELDLCRKLSDSNTDKLSLSWCKNRDLRIRFSAAVDAYREMLRLEDELAARALRLTPMDKLACNCPPCYGPKVPGKRADEPDAIICMDGNFQQRRHAAASATWRGESGVVPSLFISPDLVKMWKDKMENLPRRTGTGTAKAAEPIVSVLCITSFCSWTELTCKCL